MSAIVEDVPVTDGKGVSTRWLCGWEGEDREGQKGRRDWSRRRVGLVEPSSSGSYALCSAWKANRVSQLCISDLAGARNLLKCPFPIRRPLEASLSPQDTSVANLTLL